MNNIKLIFVKESGYFYPDTSHEHGGIDTKKLMMFNHICPSGRFHEMVSEDYFALMFAHGWMIETTNTNDYESFNKLIKL